MLTECNTTVCREFVTITACIQILVHVFGLIRCPIICCLELKSQVPACGIALDNTRCAGCRSVKRTGWTCPLFASSHLLIASVEQLMEEKEEDHLSESLLRADRGTMTTSG